MQTSRPDRRPALPLFLSPTLKRGLTAALALAAFMLANTAYLLLNRPADALHWEFFAVGETSLPRLFQAMVLTHTGVGLLLATAMAAFAILHLRSVWRRRNRFSTLSGVTLVIAGLTLAVTGLFILTAAASRDNRWAWWAHVTCAALVPTGYVVHRLLSRARPPRAAFGRFALAAGAVTVVLVVAHSFTHRGIVRTREGGLAREKGLFDGPGTKGRDVARYVDGDFVPAAFVPPESPFFPSAATTSSGGYLPSRIITRGTWVRRSCSAWTWTKRDSSTGPRSEPGLAAAAIPTSWRSGRPRRTGFRPSTTPSTRPPSTTCAPTPPCPTPGSGSTRSAFPRWPNRSARSRASGAAPVTIRR